jgi:hypothetical protein
MRGGYFSAPEKTLDPNLFDGDSLKPEVRGFILAHLYSALQAEGFKDPKSWTHIWLAGSSITYQWSDDMDVLFGINIGNFALHNTDYAGYPEEELQRMMNAYLKENLWPSTQHVTFGTQTYEMTFYVNLGSDDISMIHPYAAYNVVDSTWVVRPPTVSQDPHAMYPEYWFKWADYDRQRSDAVVRAYDHAQAELMSYPVGSPRHHDAGRRANLSAAEAGALFDDLHTGRREAFQGEQGQGYSDWHNFRWQQAKAAGVTSALASVIGMSRANRDAEDTRLYGSVLPSADDLVSRAMGNYRDRT